MTAKSHHLDIVVRLVPGNIHHEYLGHFIFSYDFSPKKEKNV